MANLLSTSITGTATTSDRIVIGGTFANNAYNSVGSTRLHFGGGDSDANSNYYIGTNLNNYGGNYTKLDLRWHTGIRMGARPEYGGIRFFNNEALGSRIMSIGETDANVRIDNNLWIGGAGGWITDLLAGKLSTGGTAANSSQLEGFSAYGLVTEARGAHSGSDFPNGTLVTTDINANVWAGDSFIMEVSGKSYGSGTPFKLIMEGYLYADTIINVSAMSYGSYFPAPVKVMRYNGNIAFWWPRGSYWNSFEVHVRSANGDSWNRVTGITDSVDPASADKKISITPTQVIHTGNIGSQSVSYASSAGSVAWGNVSGRPSSLSEFTNNLTSFPNRIEFQYSSDRYSQAWRNSSTGAYWWVTTDDDKLGLHRNGDGDKFYFSNGGDFWSSANGWLSTALAAKQNASTAINTSNIGSQSVDFANRAEFQTIPDHRGNAYIPNDYAGNRVWWHFNNKDAVGGYGTYWQAIQTVSPWSSYDPSHRQQQIQWGGTDISFRYATSGTTWSSWYRFITDANIASQTVGQVNQTAHNRPAILLNASGTTDAGGSLGMQQMTGEGWTGIFVDYEPYTGWGLWHDNPNNYFSFTAEQSTGSIRSFTVPSRESGNRTAYEKFRIDQASGDVIVGRDGYAQSSFRAPIFYDSNNTNYYVDPNSNSYLSTLRVADASSGVSLHVGVGSTHGVYTLDNARNYLVVSGDYYPHMALVARYANNTNHGAVFSLVGSEDGRARQWNIGIPNNNPFIFSIGYNATGDNNPHYGVGDGWSGDDSNHARLSIDREGNTKIRGMLYVNGTSGGISVGNPILHSGNYSSYALPLSGGTVTGISYFLTNNGGRSGATDSAKLQAYSTGNNSAFMSFHKGGYYAVNFGLDDDNVMRLGGWSAAANRMQLDMSGNVTFAGDVTAYSDARVKENVNTIESALDKTLKLRGVTYNRIDSDDKSIKIGVIAQEIIEVVPEVVNQDNDGMYNVSYGNITALLIEAIKEQQKQIDELKAKLDGLTN